MPTTAQIARDMMLDISTAEMHERADARRASAAPQPALDVGKALMELSQKDRSAIETETSLTWASRAIASFTLCTRSSDRMVQTLRFSEGDEYATEAKEHASIVTDGGKLLAYVSQQMEQAKQGALGSIVGSPAVR